MSGPGIGSLTLPKPSLSSLSSLKSPGVSAPWLDSLLSILMGLAWLTPSGNRDEVSNRVSNGSTALSGDGSDCGGSGLYSLGRVCQEDAIEELSEGREPPELGISLIS